MNEEIICVDSKFYKKCKVVMLATENNSGLLLGLSKEGKLVKYNPKTVKITNDKYNKKQHLYILSNEEIKEGDWYLYYIDGGPVLMQCVDKEEADRCNNHHHIKHICKKIIATTDNSLDIRNKDFMSLDYDKVISILPRPSDAFIQKYVEEYNKSNVITEVLVEVEEVSGYDDEQQPLTLQGNIWKAQVKTAPDNTITIKAVEETWDDILINYQNHLSMGGENNLGKYLKENYQVPKKK